MLTFTPKTFTFQMCFVYPVYGLPLADLIRGERPSIENALAEWFWDFTLHQTHLEGL